VCPEVRAQRESLYWKLPSLPYKLIILKNKS
jgi:hypothetical protein